MRVAVAIDLLNNRELATVFWLLLIFVACLLIKPVRVGLGAVGRTAVKPPLAETFAVLVMYVVLLAWIGNSIGIWTMDLISETVWWFVGTALVLLMNVSAAARDRGFFRRTFLEIFGFTLILDFLMNDLFVFSLPVELALLPAITLLGMLTIVAGKDPATRQVASMTGCLMSIAGLGIAAFVIVNVVTELDQVTTTGHLLELLLPAWLTIAFLPFLYVISVLVAYQSAFTRIKWSLRDRRALVWKVELALVSVLGAKPRYAANFVGGWIEDAAAAGSVSGMRAVVKDYRKSIEQQDKGASEERDRLERFAGVVGTDSQGLQLDRREFRETTQSLRSLATAQMGWYRNPGSRYRDDLLAIFTPTFTRFGLAEQHAVVMRVSGDGQSWYAWRRTVTGWCFAIGASGPPPNQWEFDGAEPPDGFPGEDAAWGNHPFVPAPNWEDPIVDTE